MSSSPSLILPPGATLGGFEIEDVLGVGGMAVVYRAKQLSLGRRVALKVLNPRLAADLTFRERFRREGALVAALDHPNVIPVYDFGEAEGRLYLAMRLVDGVTLADRMIDAPLSATEAVDVVKHVASALDAAHDSGLLHRDIKPQNILLSHAGAVYLADFGVAKMAGSPDLTHTGGFLGSVTYVSPEHIRGDAVGPPADVYALATVAYECLTGRTPFRRDTEAGVIHAHLSDPPAPLQADGDPSAEAVSRALMQGLEKDPAARTQSAGAFSASLASALEGLSPELRSRRPGFGPTAPGDELDTVPASETLVIDDPRGGSAGTGAPSPVPPPPVPPAPTPAPVPPPAADVQPAPVPVPLPDGGEHTIHDRRRDELVRSETKRSKADLAFKVVPALVVLIAIAIPLAFVLTKEDDPVVRNDVGALAVTPPATGWTSAPLAKLSGDAAFGLSLSEGRRYTTTDRSGTITVAPLAAGSRLSPVGLGDGERISQVRLPSGVLRRWTIGDPSAAKAPGAAPASTTPATPAPVGEPDAPTVKSVSVGITEDGPVAVLCSGPTAKVLAPCNALVLSATPQDGKLAADPDGKVNETVMAAIASAEKARSRILLPTKDRTARERRARALSRAYTASAKALDATVKARPWDPDLAGTQRALARSSTAYVRIAGAAGAKDRNRDREALKSLSAADDRLGESIGRLGRRGYVVRS
ncbi:MAG: serine/threonine-protein kinase [Solirubrobacteraceae bacterium]|nr:serine/threonine-protein kinase [Solirubrobacteraceae bacterium]